MTTTHASQVALVLVFALSVRWAPDARAGDAAACQAPEARQFDFWLGDWDASWDGGDGKPGRGTNHVERILDGCVIAEAFDDAAADQPLHGRSYSVWDPRAKLWRQTWVDNIGSYLDFTGGLADGRLILRRDATAADGRTIRQRMVFYAIERSRFDWDWETSDDGGRSWKLRWRIHYTRR